MFFLGVDIGGTKIAAAIVDASGTIVKRARIATPAAEGGDRVLATSVRLAKELVAGHDGDVSAIGIGAGGQIDSATGTVISATDLLPGWAGQALGERFQNEFHVPAFVENDVNALAVGEHRFGVARSKRLVAFLALGTGVGGCLLVDGKVQHGAHWSGGEFGHIIIDISDSARTDLGGHKGTLEAYASGHGLVTTWRDITGERREITGEEVAADAEQDAGGPAALAVAQTGRFLGLGLVSIVSAIDPEMIVIGGGLSSLGSMLLDPARTVLRERALPGSSNCPVVRSNLGADGSTIGAASVAMELLDQL